MKPKQGVVSISLNPYMGRRTIKVNVTSKVALYTNRDARGEGCVFSVELIDEDGTRLEQLYFETLS